MSMAPPDNRPVNPDPVTAAEVRRMLNSISWYFKRSNTLDVPSDLAEKLYMPLSEICRRYTS